MTNLPTGADRRVLEVAQLLKEASHGGYTAQAKLKEAAVSTSDFPGIFNEIKNYQLQAKYALEEPQVWQKIARTTKVNDFRATEFVDLGWDDAANDNILAANGGAPNIPGALPNIPEGTEYPTAFGLYSSKESLAVQKQGTRVPVTFEAIINDQWNIIDEIPTWAVRTARNSEDIEITKQLASEFGTGINTTYFNAANENLLRFGTNVAGKAALTRDTLKAALKQANNMKSGPNKNRPVRFQKFAVVIPEALRDVAEEIMDMPKTWLVTDSNISPTGPVQYQKTFSFGNNFEFVIDPWLDQIDQVTGDTAWYVVPYAGEGLRTSLAMGFLNGYEQPELRVHNDQGTLLSGGGINPRQGNFRNDTWELRLRTIKGAAALNGGLGTVASDGTAAPTIV